jgi:uncharacterized protein (DUF3084 family)
MRARGQFSLYVAPPLCTEAICHLGDQGRHVAIKVLSQGSSVQGAKEFEAEVRVPTKLRHPAETSCSSTSLCPVVASTSISKILRVPKVTSANGSDLS